MMSDVEKPIDGIERLTSENRRNYMAGNNVEQANFFPILPEIHIDETNNNKDEDEDEIERIKAVATRLKLSTRRNSTVEWKQKYMNSNGSPKLPKKSGIRVPMTIREVEDSDSMEMEDTDHHDDKKAAEIDSNLAWLRQELLNMRSQDQDLARQLIALRHEIHQLKLQKSCDEHQEMLEDAQDELEERDIISDLCDLPFNPEVDNHDSTAQLRHLGVTRMNITRRRFSLR